MHATLEFTDHYYSLDWDNNLLTDKPVLITNGEIGKQWSLFDILLDIFRVLPSSIPPKPSAILIPPSLNAKEQLLKMFRLQGVNTSVFRDNTLVYLDGHLLALETHNISDLVMGTCIVKNIKYEC